MKRLIGSFVCLTVFVSIVGCSESRETLTTDQTKDHLSEIGYEVTCKTSDINMCSLLNSSNNDAIVYSEITEVAYLSSDALYDVAANKIIEGDGDVTKLKKQYDDIIKKADVKTDEVTKLLKTEFEVYEKDIADKKKAEDEKVYKPGEQLIIREGDKDLVSLTFNSVKTTSDRNQFNKDNPAQVVVLNYNYENLNMDEDVFISSVSFTVLDEQGNVAKTYPAGTNIYPQPCPKGAKSDGEEAYGLKSESKTIKVRYSMYLPESNEKVERNFELTVE